MSWSLMNTLKYLAPRVGSVALLPFTSRNLAVDPMAKPSLPEESNKSVFNSLVPPLTLAKNFMGFEGTPETRAQEEWMKNKILQKIRNSGSLSGGIDYKDYGSKTANEPSGDWTGGYLGAPFAYGTTLGKADYSIPQTGGKVNWTGGTSYDFPTGWLGGGAGDIIGNTINTGGLANMTGGKPLHYKPDITITPQDIMNIFGGGQMMHKGEPTITGPKVQPTNEPTITPPPAAPVVPTYNPPQGPAGFTRPTRSPAQQAAAVDRKSKSMGVKSPIRRTPGTKYGFGL